MLYDFLVLALLGWFGGWAGWVGGHCSGGLGWQLIGGVNISNGSPEYFQPEILISGSCNYPPGYLPSDPTSGQSIVLGSPSILAYLND